MRDFTLQIYRRLLTVLQSAGYETLTFEQYCSMRQSGKTFPARYVILRHDVDKRPEYSVRMAELEAMLNIRASYYFRIVAESNAPDCIRRIAQLGHEIGYHYEDMSLCGGDREKAYAHFVDALAYFRQFYPVQTCCMHGAPMSQYDSRALWEVQPANNGTEAEAEPRKAYSYRDLGLKGEPYYDVDFSKVFYLTDTGRCWDGYRFSVRDKIPAYQESWTAAGQTYRRTEEIIAAAEAQRLPEAVMFTTHPQRWTDSLLPWMTEWGMQNAKNIVKAVLISSRSKRCR